MIIKIQQLERTPYDINQFTSWIPHAGQMSCDVMFIVERFNCFDKDYCQRMWRIFIIFGHTAYIHFNRINLKRFLIKTRHIETFAREHSLSIQMMIFVMLQNLNAKFTISPILYEWINNKHIKTDVFHCVSKKKPVSLLLRIITSS